MEVRAFLNTEESNIKLSNYEIVSNLYVTIKEELLLH